MSDCSNRKTISAVTEEIRGRLFAEQDAAYRDFQKKLIPSVDPEAVIGVRTPVLRSLAKEYLGREETEDFLAALPHRYFDEDQLHAFLISGIKDFGRCMELVERFLPYVDNWATCDQLSPKCFRKHRSGLLPYIRKWIASGRTYTVRFASGMLMEHFLDDDFDPALMELAASVRSDEYYVNMMTAWYFATALAKQYDAALPYLAEGRLDPWTHNKTIQKAVESFRITPQQKDELRKLRRSRS